MEKSDPPPYAEQPMPGEEQAVPATQARVQSPPAVLTYNSTPAQTYQPYPGGPTQPPMYPPMYPPMHQPVTQQPGQSTVIIHHSLATPMVPVGADPTFVRCPTCHNDVVTTIQVTPTGRTHMYALLLCLIGCWPCVCVPYCMDSCQSRNHYCPVCRALVGRTMF